MSQPVAGIDTIITIGLSLYIITISSFSCSVLKVSSSTIFCDAASVVAANSSIMFTAGAYLGIISSAVAGSSAEPT